MNSLRDNVKDAIFEYVDRYITFGSRDDAIANIADAIFCAMEITPENQDKANVKIAINPKVIVQVYRGMISLVECSDNNVKVELRDYDIDTTSDEEFKAHGEEVLTDENGDRYITR